MEEQIFIKLLIIGDSGVGKSSLLNQYCYNKFQQNSPPTVGCDFSTKLLNTSKGQTTRLQLWDIAGQERFQAVSRLYVRGALGCVIVTDVTSEESFKSSLKWKQVIEENCDYLDNSAIPIILVQNKIDLVNENNKPKYFDSNYLKNFTRENNFFDFVQTSAKLNQNLSAVFQKLTEEILRRGLTKSTHSNFGDISQLISDDKKKKGENINNKENKCC